MEVDEAFSQRNTCLPSDLVHKNPDEAEILAVIVPKTFSESGINRHIVSGMIILHITVR